jgi:hypothetical protein
MNLTDNAENLKLNKRDLDRQKKIRDADQTAAINECLEKHFDGMKTASISFHLYRKSLDLPGNRSTIRGNDWVVEDTADKIARRFSRELNRHFYGNAADRYEKKVRLVVSLHNDASPHLHIVAEVLEDRGGIAALKSFTDEFCLKSFNKFKDILPKAYVEETVSLKHSLSYNNDNDKARGRDVAAGKAKGWDFLEGVDSFRFSV